MLISFRLFVILWTVSSQAPLSMGFSRQEYSSGLPFPPPGDLPDPRIEPESPALLVDFLPSESPGKPNVVEANFNGFKCVYPVTALTVCLKAGRTGENLH